MRQIAKGDKYNTLHTLGIGTYGKVRLGSSIKSGELVAIKTIKTNKIDDEEELVRIRREIDILSSLTHEHIISVEAVLHGRHQIVLVMEYASGGELFAYVNSRKGLPDDEARRIYRQITSAVYYCHLNFIVHRDLKLENVLLDGSCNVRIADFGLSTRFSADSTLCTFCGSSLYASPEVLRRVPYRGPEIDCWSLGVLLYTLVYGTMPFDGSDFTKLTRQIMNADYKQPKEPSGASALISSLLCVKPERRATIKDACSDSWLNVGYSALPWDGHSLSLRQSQFPWKEQEYQDCSSDGDMPNSRLSVPGHPLHEQTSLKNKQVKPAFRKYPSWLQRCGVGNLSDRERLHETSGHCWKLKEVKPAKVKHKYKGSDSGCVLPPEPLRRQSDALHDREADLSFMAARCYSEPLLAEVHKRYLLRNRILLEPYDDDADSLELSDDSGEEDIVRLSSLRYQGPFRFADSTDADNYGPSDCPLNREPGANYDEWLFGKLPPTRWEVLDGPTEVVVADMSHLGVDPSPVQPTQPSELRDYASVSGEKQMFMPRLANDRRWGLHRVSGDRIPDDMIKVNARRLVKQKYCGSDSGCVLEDEELSVLITRPLKPLVKQARSVCIDEERDEARAKVQLSTFSTESGLSKLDRRHQPLYSNMATCRRFARKQGSLDSSSTRSQSMDESSPDCSLYGIAAVVGNPVAARVFEQAMTIACAPEVDKNY